MVPTSGAAGKKKRSLLLSLKSAQANDAAHQRRLALANKIVALAEAQQDEFDRWVPETPEDYTVGEYLQCYTAQPGLFMKSKAHQEASVAVFPVERKMKASVQGLDSDEDEGKTIDEEGEENEGSRSASEDEETESEVELLVNSTKQLSRLKRPSPPTISTVAQSQKRMKHQAKLASSLRIDEEGVKRLEHIRHSLSEAVKKAYIAARDRKPWFAGTSVFHFLFHNVNPYWAEITQEPYSLASMQTSLDEEETVRYI
ncbi:hypothetical protein DYB28_001544 [Aphanomyces astaci]|uniref:Uncharacterized protein n=1 Tax=Aphanomyces astaci TaxID=112090 RepID=A0A9X8HBE4_APHAT|nr:hypothetical protein DYB28_001544 [Aphanomyces astaci]